MLFGAFPQLILVLVLQLVCALAGCTKLTDPPSLLEPQLSTQAQVTPSPTPIATVTQNPGGAENVDTSLGEADRDEPLRCAGVPEFSESTDISSKYSEIALTLKDHDGQSSVQFTLMKRWNERIQVSESCVQEPGTVVLRAQIQEMDVKLFLLETVSNKLYVLDGIQLKLGKRINFGRVQGTTGASFVGKILQDTVSPLSGEVPELGWSFSVSADGQWKSGALPAGLWSVKIKNQLGESAQWLKMKLENTDVNLGDARLSGSEFLITPLWIGALTDLQASYSVMADPRFTEMRLALNPSFENVFWVPFRPIARIQIPTQGRHYVYAQLRSPDGEITEVVVRELLSERLELSAQVDAILADHTKYVSEPSTTVTTTPPPDATHHSLTVDVDELPRTWLSVGTPLPLALEASINSCGRHTIYIRFKDENGIQSQSITRTFNVRCWEKDLPLSPLEPRYAHGAAALNLSTAEGDDAVFIWGGRDATQMFNNGAILKKVDTEWTWQTLPAAPIAARIRPKIIVGRNNVLIFGGEDLSGNAVSGWAIYKISTGEWISAAAFTSSQLTNAPPALKNSAVAFIHDLLDSTHTRGAFVIAGGERSGQPNATAISGDAYYLIELNGSVYKQWFKSALRKPTSRASYSLGSDPKFLFIHAGITTPSGASADYSLSGNEFELSGDMQVLWFYLYDGYLYFPKAIYRSVDSRTGALNGHSFLFTQVDPPGSYATEEDFIKLQVMCVFGARKYSDELPQACEGTIDGLMRLHTRFCRRIYDAYYLAPVGRMGICYRPKVSSVPNEGHLQNFYLSMQNAPKERILNPNSSSQFNSASVNFSNLNLFYWSGLSPTGGEYLADGKIYYAKSDSWLPITEFEAPAPRVDHISIYLREHQRNLIWGGITATGPTAGGAFYAIL